MASPFDKYAKLYTDRKNLLFPLIEKYSGVSLSGKTHGEVIVLYYNLLQGNPSFAADVESLLTSQHFNNATAAADPLSAVAGAISSIAGIFTSSSTAKASNIENFADTVLHAQEAKNTQTYLIVGGITLASLALIGFGIYMAVKKRKS
jgi:hypothetical protein